MREVITRFREDADKRREFVRMVAQATGIPIGTLRKIRRCETNDPRGSTLEKLEAFYSKQ